MLFLWCLLIALPFSVFNTDLKRAQPCLRANLTLLWLDGCKINKIVCSCNFYSLSPFPLPLCTSITHSLTLVNYWKWFSITLSHLQRMCALVCVCADAEYSMKNCMRICYTKSKMNGKSLKRCFKSVYNISQTEWDWLLRYALTRTDMVMFMNPNTLRPWREKVKAESGSVKIIYFFQFEHVCVFARKKRTPFVVMCICCLPYTYICCHACPCPCPSNGMFYKPKTHKKYQMKYIWQSQHSWANAQVQQKTNF